MAAPRLLPVLPVLLGLVVLGCRSQIHHGLDERDANELVSVLVSRGFDAQKVPEKGKKPTWAIELDDEHATDALRVLAELKLPRTRALTTRDVVSQVGLIETPSAERMRQLEAQEGDVEQALETMDGVSSASVELVVPPPPRPGALATPSKASVLVRVQPESYERIQRQRSDLRALVAASVDGLRTDDVVLVVDVANTQVPSPVEPKTNGLRVLVTVLGLTVSVLAVAVVTLVSRLRRRAAKVPANVPAEKLPTPAPKPVVAPAVQKKAA